MKEIDCRLYLAIKGLKLSLENYGQCKLDYHNLFKNSDGYSLQPETPNSCFDEYLINIALICKSKVFRIFAAGFSGIIKPLLDCYDFPESSLSRVTIHYWHRTVDNNLRFSLDNRFQISVYNKTIPSPWLSLRYGLKNFYKFWDFDSQSVDMYAQRLIDILCKAGVQKYEYEKYEGRFKECFILSLTKLQIKVIDIEDPKIVELSNDFVEYQDYFNDQWGYGYIIGYSQDANNIIILDVDKDKEVIIKDKSEDYLCNRLKSARTDKYYSLRKPGTKLIY